MKIRLCGDVHGKYDKYYNLIKDQQASIQLGDLGFSYKILDHLDSTRHIVIPGNHDNYDIVHKYDHILDSFGEYEHCGLEFFFVRGGFSIDWQFRLHEERQHGPRFKSWWQQEELSIAKLENAINLYEMVKPKVVLTHECPRSIVKNITDGRILKDYGYDPEKFTTRTSEALDAMLRVHEPDLWVFGHYHRSLDKTIGKTRFKCLAELEHFDLEV